MSTADRRQLTRRLPPLEGADEAVIERFLDAAWAGQGLSPATLSAYRSDLQALARWLRAERGVALAQAQSDHLFDYLAMRAAAGFKPRSTARLP